MSTINYMVSIKKLFEYPWFTVPVTAIILAIILYLCNNTDTDNFLIIIILTFIITDFITWVFVKEGHGIFQFLPTKTQTEHRGHAFIIFFPIIILVAYTVNLGTIVFTALFSSLYSNFINILVICLILSILVYLDLYIRVFINKKK